LLNRLGYVDNTLGTVNRNYSYVYDDASRMTSTTEPRGTIASGYTNRNEVNSITEPSGSPFADQSFTFDAGFNRATWVLGSTTTSYTANNLDQYSEVGSSTPTWNTDGGLATFAGKTYVYDALKRLTEVDYSSGKTLFSYDPLGRRVKKVDLNTSGTVLSTFAYHYDGSEVAVEYQPGTTWTYYLGLGLDQVVMRDSGSAKQWYYRDGHGSTSAVADNSGNVLEQYEYTAQGHFQITNASGTVLSGTGIANDILYTGRNYDYETGNYFYRARYYNPVLGRFISRDLLSGAEFSQGTNLYAYTSNSYLNMNDPMGLNPVTYTAGAADGIGAIATVTTDGDGDITGASLSVVVGEGAVASATTSSDPTDDSPAVSGGLAAQADADVGAGTLSSDASYMTGQNGNGATLTTGSAAGVGDLANGTETQTNFTPNQMPTPGGTTSTTTAGLGGIVAAGPKLSLNWGSSSSSSSGSDPDSGNGGNTGPRNIPSNNGNGNNK
jgi:RHS repeat-associated protein